MSDTRGRSTPVSQTARIVTGVAATLVVVLAVVLVVVAGRTGNEPVPGAMHSNSDGGMAGGAGADMMMSSRMMANDEGEYLVEMIAHHDEAVAAAPELSRSERAELRGLGEAIVTSQTAQIAQMRQWKARWHDDANQAAYQPMMRDLGALTGDELERRFLEDMVMHHRMAVMMSRHLLGSTADLHPEVADLARDIVREQSAEIRQMRRWLADWFGVTAPGMGSGLPMMPR